MFIVPLFTYKGCVFEIELENRGKSKYEFYGKLHLVSVSDEVLEIPDTYEGQTVNIVYVSEISSAADTDNLFGYCEVDTTEFPLVL